MAQTTIAPGVLNQMRKQKGKASKAKMKAPHESGLADASPKKGPKWAPGAKC